MRLIVRVAFLGASFAMVAGVSAREPFRLLRSRPESIQEVVDALRGDDAATAIPAYLDEAQCGGWDKTLDVEPLIATVRGVPGRLHDPLGDVRSGMGKRIDIDGNGNIDDDFQYPDTAEGLTTACEPGKDRVTRSVLRPVRDFETVDGEIVTEFAPEDHEFNHPFFQDPSCRWRMEGGGRPGVPLEQDPGDIFRYDKDSVETEDPDSCLDFCGYLNNFLYQDCVDPQRRDIDVFDGDGNVQTINILTCNREGLKYLCTEEEAQDGDIGAACTAPHPDVDEWANARLCRGEQCRCDGTMASCVRVQENPDKPAYVSYFRRYRGSYDRAPLDAHVPNDQSSKGFDVACFGFYEEFDLLTRRTADKDRRCVINIDVETMRETQKGKGIFREENVVDRDPTDPGAQRPGDEEDLWYEKLGGAFSFLNEEPFETLFGRDLGTAFLAFDELDTGAQTATPQISPDKPLTEDDLLRAFDDTGAPRAFVRWWQEQQSRMAAFLHPSVLRITLPSAVFLGADPNDPFLTGATETIDPSRRIDRGDRIELQIEAGEDAVGSALAYLERSLLLHIEEEPIDIVVPLGSPLEFRARAADWCNWYKSEESEPTCDDAPAEIRQVMDRLEEYAQRIDDYRALRAELAKTTGAVLDLQRRILEPITTWFADHREELRAIGQGRAQAELELVPLWNAALATTALLHERTNLPWCMNQRYTAPVRSLTDKIDEQNLPALPLVARAEDILLDFSTIVTMTGSLQLPVLKPVPFGIDIPVPPEPFPLAELPPIDEIRAALEEASGRLPAIDDRLVDPPSLEPPAPLAPATLADARIALEGIVGVVSTLEETYRTFWESIGPIEPGKEQFDRQIEFKTGLKCRDFNSQPCAHPEPNLLEAAQRIGSRPLIQGGRDFESVGTPRSEATVCLPEDETCAVLNAERDEPDFQWEVRGAATNDAPVEELRLRILTLTQPPPLGTLDPRFVPLEDGRSATFVVFPPIRLTP